LRQAQRELTRERILQALADLIVEENPLEISLSAVAKRAGVSEPTLYRHFPHKKELFAALATYQFRSVAAGLAPTSVDELARAVLTVFERSQGMENLVRWTLAATDPERVPRPNVQARLAMLREALRGTPMATGNGQEELVLRSVLLLTSPMAWLYWKDYLGLDVGEAAATAGWAIKALVASPLLSGGRTSSPRR
jgi:AcrR family transcriptional regulator